MYSAIYRIIQNKHSAKNAGFFFSGVKEALLYEEGKACNDGDDCTTFYGSECEDGLCIAP